ncbi:MAG: MerR family transcriptional regulator [Syntrophomonas sp.]
MDRLKIDQVALQSGLTKRTIRYYEEIGLLPSPQRSKGSIRYYTQDHVQLLIKIKDIKNALGLSLEELQKFISIDNTIESHRKDYKKSVERAEQKENLTEIISNLDAKINLIEQKMLTMEQVRRDLINLKSRAQAMSIQLPCKD